MADYGEARFKQRSHKGNMLLVCDSKVNGYSLSFTKKEQLKRATTNWSTGAPEHRETEKERRKSEKEHRRAVTR